MYEKFKYRDKKFIKYSEFTTEVVIINNEEIEFEENQELTAADLL